MVDALEAIRTVRQIRQFATDPVPDDVLAHLLHVARWTGSARNSQPWHFIVVRDKDQLQALSQFRQQYWLASAPLGIAIVLDGADPTDEAYDEGRVAERILVAANALGYGAGVAWYGKDYQAEAKRILGIPAERTARSMVMIGRAASREDPRGPGRRPVGRKPLSELVSYDRWGERRVE